MVKSSIIRQVLEGQVPDVNINVDGHFPFILQKSEKLIWAFSNVEYYEQRVRRERRGGYSGVSLHVMKGVYYHNGPSRPLRDSSLRGEISLVISPQVLMEFFAVVTNPQRVTNPRPPQEAREEIEKYLSAVTLGKIHHSEDIIERMLTLLQQHSEARGQEVFDLYLVATMLSDGVRRIYTYNQQHFSRFQGIEVLTP